MLGCSAGRLAIALVLARCRCWCGAAAEPTSIQALFDSLSIHCRFTVDSLRVHPVQAATGLAVWAERQPAAGAGQVQGATQRRAQLQAEQRRAGLAQGLARAAPPSPSHARRRSPSRLCCRDSARLRLCKVGGCTFVNQYLVVKYLGRCAALKLCSVVCAAGRGGSLWFRFGHRDGRGRSPMQERGWHTTWAPMQGHGWHMCRWASEAAVPQRPTLLLSSPLNWLVDLSTA